MSTKHTPTPWRVTDDHHARFVMIRHQDYSAIAQTAEEADAKHIVSCVNACEGINPEAVPDMLSALKEVAKDLRALGIAGEPLDRIRAAIAKAEAKHD